MALRQARLEEAAGLLHPQPAATEEAPAEDQRLAALPGLQPAVGGQQRLHAQALAEVSQEQRGDVAPKSSTLSSLLLENPRRDSIHTFYCCVYGVKYDIQKVA